MNRRRALLLLTIAAALAGVLVIGLARGDLVDAVLRHCTPAPGDWLADVDGVVADYRRPCTRFYWKPGGEFYHLVRLNNYGTQDRDLMLDKPPGTYRILILGDSFAQGWQVALQDNFPWRLEVALNTDPARPVEVINLSLDSIGTDRQLLTYAALGWRFQPDLVLLAFYAGNDIKDVYPGFGALELQSSPQRPFFSLNPAGELQLHNAPAYAAERFPESAAWGWLAAQTADATPATAELPAAPTVTSAEPYTLEYPVDLGLYLPEDNHWRQAWALTDALLRELHAVVTADGIPFGVVIIPDRRAVHAADWDATVTAYPFMQGRDARAPLVRLEALITAADIPVLNMLYTLQGWAAARPDERLYFAGDGHFNEKGHQVVTDRLRFWLSEQGWVD